MTTEMNEKVEYGDIKSDIEIGKSPYNEKSRLDEDGLEKTVTKDDIKLHPQPTTDPLDPLNWTWFQKHSILGIVMFKYFMFTYITTTTVPSFPELQGIFGISYSLVNWTVAIPALGLAIGPLVWSSLAEIYGRRIIFVIGTIIALAATIGAAKSGEYGGYMAARFFQGFGVSPGSTVGMAVVGDLFFDHERAQKLGLWVLAIDSGLLVGPIIGGFIDLVSPEWIQWLTAILFGTLLALELAFMPETLYPRTHMLSLVPMAAEDTTLYVSIEKVGRRRSNAGEVELLRTKKLAFINYKPVPGMVHPRPWDSCLRFGLMFKFPAVSIAVLVFCFTWYWWVLSVITMQPAAYAQYSPQIQGLLFLGLLLGTLFAEVFCSGRLSDWLVLKLAKRNNNIKVAEMRLWLAYPAALLSAIGLIIWGISVDKNYHWIVGQVAFFLFAAGIQIGNTCVTSYVIDCYPLQSMSVVTFYAVCLNVSAFINPFFIAPWQASSGWTWTFTVPGIIIIVLSIPVFVALHRFGPKIRASSGQPSWVNPEFG